MYRSIQGCIPSVLYTVERVVGYTWVRTPPSLQKKYKNNENYLEISKIFVIFVL